MMLVWVLSVAFASGQAFYRVNLGSANEYKITKPAGEITYTWQTFTDASLTTLSCSDQVLMTVLGMGRENEIKVNWLAEGDFFLLVSVLDAKGCSNRMAWHFVVGTNAENPTARIAGPSKVALASCDVKGHVIDASGSTGTGLVFNWSPSTYLDNPSSSKPKFIPGKTTRYLLSVTDNTGRKDTTSVLMVVENAPLAVTDKIIFVSEPNKTILLDGSKSNGVGLTYLWLSKEGIILSGETTAMAEVSGLGSYYLKNTDSYGCVSNDSVQVSLYTQAVKDTAYTRVNFAIDINVLYNDIPKNELNPATLRIVTHPQNGTAVVQADSLISYTPNQYFVGSDDFVYSICDYFNHCDEAKVLVMINDVPFFIPEAFSPNGDGINDRFEIKGLEKYKTVEIQVFNRWGNVVYHSKNYGEGNGKLGFWDGIGQSRAGNNTGPVSTGIYFYVLKATGGQNISGSIYLDR